MARAVCMAMDASVGRHDDMFSYRVIAGRAEGSYGLRTAAVAGLPASVLRRAEILITDPSAR